MLPLQATRYLFAHNGVYPPVELMVQLDSPCVYDLKKNKPGIKAGAVGSLSRRVGKFFSHGGLSVLIRCFRGIGECTPRKVRGEELL